MRILIVGINYAPEQVGIAVYTSGFAEELVRRGDHVTVICAPPHFPNWQVRKGYSTKRYQTTTENGVKVVRCPTYIPTSTGAFRRICHYLSFSISSLPAAIAEVRRTKPDVVFSIAPTLLSAYPTLIAARAVRAKTWLHVQDFEIEAAFATGILKQGLLIRLARRAEALLMRRFDRVSSISGQMLLRLAARGVPPERCIEFRNWSNLQAIVPLQRPSVYRQRWGIKAQYVALYSGSIGNKQGLELIVEAARRLRSRNDLIFVICGEGPNRSALEGLAAGLPNVRFEDSQLPNQLNELLGLATVHLLPQLAGAADNVLPSKLTNILASGRPVIATASHGTALYQEVESCGLLTPPGDSEKMAYAISEVLSDDDLRRRLGTAARERAEVRLSSDVILNQVREQIRELLGVVQSC